MKKLGKSIFEAYGNSKLILILERARRAYQRPESTSRQHRQNDRGEFRESLKDD